tara:strand:- start:125 stop:604 length:480 start_codon:yes stop_codon:yes gene_type:complete
MNPDETSRSLENELCLRLVHGNNSPLQKNRCNTDRIGARHRRSIGWLHDEKPHVGVRVLRRDEKIDMAEYPSPRLIENEVAQDLILGQEVALFPEALTGRGSNPAHDNITHFSLRVAVDNLDGFRDRHLPTGSSKKFRIARLRAGIWFLEPGEPFPWFP